MAYERIVAAAMKGESALWELGDEIIAETSSFPRARKGGLSTGLHKKLKGIADELVNCGLNQYREKRLGEIRNVALDFDAANRIKGLSFYVHGRAGTPEKLKNVIEHAASVGRIRPISAEFIKVYEGAEKEYRREARNEAITAKEEATAKLERAREDLRKANSPQAKAAAEKLIKEAEEEKKAAGELANDLKSPPPVNHNVPSKGRASRSMLEIRTGFAADLSTAKSLAERMDKDVDPHIDNLPDTFIDMAAEELLEIAEMFRKLSFKIRGRKTNKRSHLYAVGE